MKKSPEWPCSNSSGNNYNRDTQNNSALMVIEGSADGVAHRILGDFSNYKIDTA